MNAALRSCKRCHSAMRVEAVNGVGGSDGGVKVRIAALPALQCERGHRQFVTAGFPATLLKKLSGEISVPAARSKGLLVKRLLCGQCGGELGAGEPVPKTWNIDVALEGLEPFRVELTVPVHRCAGCGCEQARSPDEIERQVPAAIAQAFQSAEIPPG